MSNLRKFINLAVVPFIAFTLSTAMLGSTDAATYSKPPASFSSSVKPSAAPTFTYSKPPATAFAPSPAATTYSKPPIVAAPTFTPAPSPAATTYSKPPIVAAPTFTPAPAQPTNNSYTKPPLIAASPSATTQSFKPHVYNPANALSASSSRVMSNDTLKQYQAERSATKNPPQPVDVGAVRRDPSFAIATSRYPSVDSYMSARNNYIGVYRNAHPDVYIYTSHMYPNYGAYDSGFLMGMMLGYVGSSAANSQWMYAHQNDPWYAQYHADLVRQAQDNADIRAKLEAQDAELARLKATGVAPTVQALPAGIDASIAIAPEAMIANASLAQEDDSHTFRNVLIGIVVLISGGLIFFYIIGRK